MVNDNLPDDRSLEEIIPPEGKSNSQIDKEISDLERAHEIISKPVIPEVEDVKISNPSTKVEEALASYIDTKTKMDLKRNDFSELIMEKISSRLDTMSTEQLLGLFGTDRVTSTDSMSKLINPTTQMLTTKQQAEIAAENRRVAAAEKASQNGNVQIAIGMPGANPVQAAQVANEKAPREALQGLDMISHLLQAMNKQDEKKETIPIDN